eukprot:21957-Pyramimonas_sp.AAC.2
MNWKTSDKPQVAESQNLHPRPPPTSAYAPSSSCTARPSLFTRTREVREWSQQTPLPQHLNAPTPH